MLDKDEIIQSKIRSRGCRKQYEKNQDVQSVVDECCNILKITPPNLICCDSLERSFCQFRLMNEDYIIYDSCLMEILYIYNQILDDGLVWNDVKKFFNKLFGEEYIRIKHYKKAGYFIGKYKQYDFSFDKIDGDNESVIMRLSYQRYFLIAHELCHLMIKSMKEGIPRKYKEFVRGAIGALAEREIRNRKIDINKYISERSDYFSISTDIIDVKGYINVLEKSLNYRSFVEECYCDFMGFKLLVENYQAPQSAIYAISSALNFLILQESIRSDINESGDDLKNLMKEASPTLYFSVLRTQMLLFTLQMNRSEDIRYAFEEINDRDRLMEELELFIRELPDKDIMEIFDGMKLPDTNEDVLSKALMHLLYYCSA